MLSRLSSLLMMSFYSSRCVFVYRVTYIIHCMGGSRRRGSGSNPKGRSVSSRCRSNDSRDRRHSSDTGSSRSRSASRSTGRDRSRSNSTPESRRKCVDPGRGEKRSTSRRSRANTDGNETQVRTGDKQHDEGEYVTLCGRCGEHVNQKFSVQVHKDLWKKIEGPRCVKRGLRKQKQRSSRNTEASADQMMRKSSDRPRDSPKGRQSPKRDGDNEGRQSPKRDVSPLRKVRYSRSRERSSKDDASTQEDRLQKLMEILEKQSKQIEALQETATSAKGERDEGERSSGWWGRDNQRWYNNGRQNGNGYGNGYGNGWQNKKGWGRNWNHNHRRPSSSGDSAANLQPAHGQHHPGQRLQKSRSRSNTRGATSSTDAGALHENRDESKGRDHQFVY